MRFTQFTTGLTEDHHLLIDSVTKFANQVIAPLASELDASNTFPNQLWQELGNMGLLGVTVDEQYGGLSLGYFEHTLIMALISEASASVGLSYGAHSNLCVSQIFRNGTDEQKLHYLPPLISGEKIGALAMSETQAGSDVVSMKLAAREDSNGDFILNGHKMWITNGPDADVVVLYAKTNPELESKGITAFILDKDCPGWRAAQKLDKLGMRGSNTCELIFDKCKIPRKNVIGAVNDGVGILMSGLDYERIVLAGGPIGIMQSCVNTAFPYISERTQFNQPVGAFQLMQGKIADMYTAIAAATSLVFNSARNFDQGLESRVDASAAILFASEHATQIALQTIQCLGGNGYTNDYCAGRLLRDAKLYEIGAGTNEIRRMLIGRELLKQYQK